MFSEINHSDVIIARVCSESAQPPVTLSSIMITKVAMNVAATQDLFWKKIFKQMCVSKYVEK